MLLRITFFLIIAAVCSAAPSTQIIKQEIDTVFAQDSYFIQRRQIQDTTLKQCADMTAMLEAVAQRNNSGETLNEEMLKIFLYGLMRDADDALYLSPEKFPNLYTVMRRLCEHYQIPLPLLFLSEKNDFCNAMAISLDSSCSVVLVGKVLINALNDDELSGVLAHELGHIKYNHSFQKMRMLLCLCGMNIAMFGAGYYYCPAKIFPNSETKISLFFGIAFCLGFLEAIFVNAFSRACEREADDAACGVFDKPSVVVDFFKKLVQIQDEKHNKNLQDQLFVLEHVKALIKSNPEAAGDLLSTIKDQARVLEENHYDALHNEDGSHPSLIHRIERLQQRCAVLSTAPAQQDEKLHQELDDQKVLLQP